MIDENILVRAAVAKALAHQQRNAPHLVSLQRYGHESRTTRLLEKAIFDSENIGNDANFRAAQRGFIELVRARSLIGRIPGWRRAEFHTPTLNQTVSTSASFVEQGAPVPVTATDLSPISLPPANVASILTTTKEVIEGTGAGSESSLTSDLTRAIGDAESAALIDPVNAGTGDLPASLTYGVTPVPASGVDAAALRYDLGLLLNNFSGDLESAVLIMHPNLALRLMLMQHPLGSVSLTLRGGDLFGVPVFCSSAVPYDSAASPIILIDPTRVVVAQGDINIDVARHASLEVSAAPDDPTTASTVMVNLWQKNLVALMVSRSINWEAAPGAVSWISGADYGAPSAV